MKIFLFILMYALFAFNYSNGAMTEKQFAAAMKLVRNVCQPKFKISDAEIEESRKGNWDVSQDFKCYLACGFNMYKLIRKDNSFDYELFIKTWETQGPVNKREGAIATINKCKNVATNFDDKCEVSYLWAKCIYEDDPPNYYM